ncbi:hypothetical protein MJM28_29695, partial [Salmonella enterica subsp. enterica serovar Montevideo]|nr:hypothetical protein [Salmonella enterica subsp. enterica serovar Montevideo]
MASTYPDFSPGQNRRFFSRLITVAACFFIFSAAWFCLWSISLHLVERPELAALLFPF